MVAEAHPITHPPKTSRRLWLWRWRWLWLLPATATAIQMTAQTTPQPMLYAV
jgi:hypothetical protein